MLANIRTYLIDNSVNFTTSNVFVDGIPSTPRQAVMVERDEGGSVTEAGYFRLTVVRFFVRHSTYSNAESWCQEIIDLLHNKSHLNSVLKEITLLEDIVHDSMDENYYVLSFTMEVTVLEGG